RGAARCDPRLRDGGGRGLGAARRVEDLAARRARALGARLHGQRAQGLALRRRDGGDRARARGGQSPLRLSRRRAGDLRAARRLQGHEDAADSGRGGRAPPPSRLNSATVETPRMATQLRRGRREDAAACGVIAYEAFKAIADAHNYPPDFPSAEVATEVLSMLLAHPAFYSVVAEQDGRIVGSNFLAERSMIGGVGPITVTPSLQNSGVGRALMEDVLARAKERRTPGVRLVQAAFHRRSLALYAKLGFDIRETLSCMQGVPIRRPLEGYAVRPGTERDLAACCACVCMATIEPARSGTRSGSRP